MRSHRLSVLVLFALCAIVLGCPSRPPIAPPAPPPPTVDQSIEDLSGDDLDALMKAHFEGVGAMEQYRYNDAVQEFRKVHKLAPAWRAGTINLAIALLNDIGLKSEESKKAGGEVSQDNFAESLKLLDGVLAKDPEDLTARYCRGVILQYLGELAAAHKDFQAVVDRDPGDGHTWFRLASTLTDPERPGMKAGLKQADELIALYEKALRRNPYLVPAYYNMFLVMGWAAAQAKSPEERERLFARQREFQATFQRLNPQMDPTGTGERGGNVFGEMGKHARLIGPGPPRPVEDEDVNWPRLDRARSIDVALPEGHRWANEGDFAGTNQLLGRIRDRFGAAVAVFDVDGDGRLDIYLAAAVIGPKGLRDVLLLNRGEGKFEDASARYGLPDRPSTGVAAGDFDADRHIDLYLTAVGDNRLLQNVDGRKFDDVTEKAGISGTPALSLTARWLDIDQDGDLDLYVINYTDLGHADEAFLPGDSDIPGFSNAAYRNDGRPVPFDKSTPEANLTPEATATSEQPGKGGLSLAFKSWPDAEALLGGARRHSGLAALDIDDDRDIDFVLIADEAPAAIVLNDRLGRFTATSADSLIMPPRVSGLVVADLDRDGRADLVATQRRGASSAWVNRSSRGDDGAVVFRFEPKVFRVDNWSGTLACDLDLDGRADFLGVAHDDGTARIAWVRDGASMMDAQRVMPSGTGLNGLALADLVGDPLPDLLAISNESRPLVLRNLGNGNHWLALDLGGRWKFSFDQMRTNPHGLGARVMIQARDLFVPFDHTTQAGGLGQSVAPFVLGLRDRPAATLLHVTWPDGVMQAELNVPSNQLLALAEYNRKTGSCPVLFAWDGRRFVCVGDFLGGGGLGYLVAPGTYSEPDRDEAILIAPGQLRDEQGTYRLRVLEPMDEVAYLDHLQLDVVDAPGELTVAPDERFAPGGNRPTGRLLAWETEVRPERATDLLGRDITERLAAFDRVTVDDFRKLRGWIGYAEEHGIVLDFGDRLARFGPTDRLVLALAGWVEYPYSQTNYAAATAGVPLTPPVLERLGEDGRWTMIEADPGYPAGLPRRTTLELTGKLGGPRCVLRLRTNMECYWDQAFVAVLNTKLDVRVTTLNVHRANLSYRGYVREVSPDGRPPLLYDYQAIDPAPLARFRGKLTRHGEVTPLLHGDDDQFCVVGPGDDLALEFDAREVPALPNGWTRRFVLRAIGYCKDADPFTAASDDVGPLPFRDMPGYPYGPGEGRPAGPAYQTYLDSYQTRPAGAP
jgi:tetratricopeptide (TPR) repeat protein